MIKHLAVLLAVLMSTATISVNAEQSKSFGNYTVHFSAFTTDILTPDVAKNYRISRSKNRVLLNISVLKKVMGTAGSPVKAKVDATATNLSSQLRKLDVRELEEYEAIYYIAETMVNNEETLKYTLSITPEGETEPYTFSFQQQFFTQ
jgi:Domain of unknown function (DUF4426)